MAAGSDGSEIIKRHGCFCFVRFLWVLLNKTGVESADLSGGIEETPLTRIGLPRILLCDIIAFEVRMSLTQMTYH